MRSIVRAGGDEAGAIAIIVAILVTVLGLFMAIVVDVGYMYETRRQLQAAADAAALAAMTEKINGGSDEEALAVAEDYAEKNDFKTDVGTDRGLAMITSPPLTEVTDNSVKITVKKSVNLFFAPLFALLPGVGDGYTSEEIRAQARAKRVYLTGGEGLMPWGAMTVKPTRIIAHVNGSDTELSHNSGTDLWEGSLTAPASPDTTGRQVDLTVYNGQDYPKEFEGVGSLTTFASSDSVTDVYFADDTLSPGQSTTLYVRTNAAPRARIDNKTYNSFSNLGGGLYSTTVSAPTSSEPFKSFSVEVTAGGQTFSNATRLMVRSPTFPLEDVEINTSHFAPGGGSTAIRVKMETFEYGEEYHLKVVSDPEAGNFNALDFRYITHPDGTSEGENDNASDYYSNLQTPYPGIVHIGDTIATLPGNKSSAQTGNALTTRFANCSLTFVAWEASGKPANCSRLVMVPVIEHIESITGQSNVKVVEIAVFFVESYTATGDRIDITGRFVQYSKPGIHSDEPPDGGLYVETARLEKPDY